MKTVEDKTILFCPLREDVIIPTRDEENAGFDVYANFSEDYMVILPGETRGIPTGLASVFSKDYVAVLKERGSTGTKGIGQRAGVIDSNYRGEWFVPVTNHNPLPMVIMKDGVQEPSGDYMVYPYSKAITQCLLLEVPAFKTRVITKEELAEYPTARGAGCKGSSGK